MLLDQGHEVRCLVRDPRRLGPKRVRVQLSLADLGDPRGLRHAVRGADTVIHLAAAMRDQPHRKIEEITALGTHRVLAAAESAGVERFVFFSALGATSFQRTRFFRSKALAEKRVRSSALETTIFAPSIIYDRDDTWVTWIRRLALLPLLPISGRGQAAYEPIWAPDAARAVLASLERAAGPLRARRPGAAHLRAAGAADRRRGRARAARDPHPAAVRALGADLAAPDLRRGRLRHLGGGGAARGADDQRARTADVRGLGVDPAAMASVLDA